MSGSKEICGFNPRRVLLEIKMLLPPEIADSWAVLGQPGSLKVVGHEVLGFPPPSNSNRILSAESPFMPASERQEGLNPTPNAFSPIVKP